MPSQRTTLVIVVLAIALVAIVTSGLIRKYQAPEIVSDTFVGPRDLNLPDSIGFRLPISLAGPVLVVFDTPPADSLSASMLTPIRLAAIRSLAQSAGFKMEARWSGWVTLNYPSADSPFTPHLGSQDAGVLLAAPERVPRVLLGRLPLDEIRRALSDYGEGVLTRRPSPS